MKKRVTILISGRGSNMERLIQASKNTGYPAEIVGVISNKIDAAGLDIAEEYGVQTAIIERQFFASKFEYDTALDAQLNDWQSDLVCLAGFMQILSADFTNDWAGKLINIHPSLLPLYKGLDTHNRALADSAKTHGCTAHFVTPGMDEGPTILQAEIAVLADDTPDSLQARVLIEEHRIYPQALEMVCDGRASFPQPSIS